MEDIKGPTKFTGEGIQLHRIDNTIPLIAAWVPAISCEPALRHQATERKLRKCPGATGCDFTTFVS